jgi:hypothetical protein
MKSTVLTGALLLAGTIVHAQLSFLPQVGFEQSRTTLNYNSLAASGANGNLRAGLKMDYRLKGGHGPYLNVGTSPAPINFAFDNTGQLVKGMQQAKNNLQLRLEAGYQYTSKAIQFGKGKRNNSNAASEATTETLTKKKSCGSVVYKSSCGNKRIMRKSVLADNNLNMRLQPSLGLAYLPAANDRGIKQTANGFEYNATNWKTAVVPAMGFEFAKGKQRLLTLTVFYTKPLGMQDESFTSATGNKAVTTNLSPAASTWGMTVGVPFSFSKAPVSKTKKAKTHCSKSVYKRCVRIQ